MKLRHLLTTAAVAALAVTPLAATGTAGAAAFDAHSTRFNDTSPDQHIVGTIDIQNVHLYRNTKADFVAVVKYKDLVKRPATKWIVTFGPGFFEREALGIPPTEPDSTAMEYRIGPDGKTAAFGYQFRFFSDETPKPTTCAGFAAKADFTADTITYTVPQKCWTTAYDPAGVGVMTRLFKKSEWRSNYESYYTEEPNRTDDASGTWSWGDDSGDVKGAPSKDIIERNPFHR